MIEYSPVSFVFGEIDYFRNLLVAFAIALVVLVGALSLAVSSNISRPIIALTRRHGGGGERRPGRPYGDSRKRRNTGPGRRLQPDGRESQEPHRRDLPSGTGEEESRDRGAPSPDQSPLPLQHPRDHPMDGGHPQPAEHRRHDLFADQVAQAEPRLERYDDTAGAGNRNAHPVRPYPQRALQQQHRIPFRDRGRSRLDTDPEAAPAAAGGERRPARHGGESFARPGRRPVRSGRPRCRDTRYRRRKGDGP